MDNPDQRCNQCQPWCRASDMPSELPAQHGPTDNSEERQAGQQMNGKIEETMTSQIEVQLTDRNTSNIVFEGTGNHAGLEVAGAVEDIITS